MMSITRQADQFTLSDEDRVSVAEQVMERAGHGGRHFIIPTATVRDAQPLGLEPRQLQRIHSREAEEFVNGALGERGPVRVEPQHWNLRQPGSGQAVTDGANYIGLAGNDTNAMTLLHETAHIVSGTPHGPGGHGPGFQHTVHDLYRDHISPEAADTFAKIVWPR